MKTRTLTHAVWANLLAASTLVLSAGSSAYAEELLVPSSRVTPSDVLGSQKLAKLDGSENRSGARRRWFSRAAEVGVLEVFDREGLKFDYIVGTSIGSIVGGLYDAGCQC